MSTALARQQPMPLREIAPGHYETPPICINIVIPLQLVVQVQPDPYQVWLQEEKLRQEQEKVAELRRLNNNLEKIYWAQG
jgi:hypothetical protein